MILGKIDNFDYPLTISQRTVISGTTYTINVISQYRYGASDDIVRGGYDPDVYDKDKKDKEKKMSKMNFTKNYKDKRPRKEWEK